MAEDTTVDVGLEELTSDILGPADASATETQSQPGSEPVADPVEEPTQTEQVEPASAQAPTPAAPAQPDLVEINGRKYTREQLAQTLSQFPHLQERYLELKREREQREAATPQVKTDPAHVLSQIRASFDGSVKTAIADGFMEEDFGVLYPNLAASMVMNRDALTAGLSAIGQIREEINEYRGQIVAERTRGQIDNNMLALSTEHEIFAPLSDPVKRQEFLEFIRAQNPPMSLMNDRDAYTGWWLAFNRNTFMPAVDTVKAKAATAAAARANARRLAQGDPLTGSRPAAVAPTGTKSPLDEMVDDVLSGNVVPR